MNYISEIIRRDQFLIESGSHSRDAIIIVLEGAFRCSIDDQQYIAQSGDICVFHALQNFQRQVLHPMRCLYIQFEPFPIPLPTGILKTADPVRTQNTLVHLEQAVATENSRLIEHLIWDVFLMLRSHAANQSSPDETVSKCIDIFSQHYSQRISLDSLSKKLSITKQGLIQKFKKQTGVTPMVYLSGIRLDRSKQLLKNTDLPITEIARQCGFENVYYFSSHFKKQTGISPTDYRKLMAL